jgi:hypothetical protein
MSTWTNIAILQENNSGHFDKDFEALCAKKLVCVRHTRGTLYEPHGD